MRSLFLLAAALTTAASAAGQDPVAGRNTVTIRGKQQAIYLYPGTGGGGSGPPRKVLYAPGDLGMRGAAVDFAREMASWGYDVYGLDTRQYLSSFTGESALQTGDVMNDFRRMAAWAGGGSADRMALVGWSEGAGLTLLAATADENKAIFCGLVVFGLDETNALSWTWTGYLLSLARKNRPQPGFASRDLLPRVTPLPLVMIQSSGDQYVSVATAKELFAVAREPKRMFMVTARNHRFDGNREEFYRRLRASLEWLKAVAP